MSGPPELFDLHAHSTRSDGLRSVLELAQLAKLSGLSGLAITDHDVLPDRGLLKEASRVQGIEMLVGIELSTIWKERRLHLLGYGFDADAPDLVAVCKELRHSRLERWERLVEGLRAKKVPLDDVAIKRMQSHGAPGRKHLAREIIRAKRASSARIAFDRYLSPIDENLPPIGVEFERAVEAIHQASGKAILAHPPTGMLCEEWRSLASMGIDGVETRFGRIATRHQKFLEERVAEYGWIATAGSDYHGDGTRQRLGLHTVRRETVNRLTLSATD